jgi:predicted phosphodiesterase
MKPTIITCISDTHGSQWEVDLPPPTENGILIHAGDWGSWGSFQEMIDFDTWLGTTGYPETVIISGNHDKIAEQQGYQLAKQMFSNAIYLENDLYISNSGLKIYGTPFTETYGNWSFMRSEEDLDKIWAKVPEGIDVLIVHGPCFGILDEVKLRNGKIENTGSVTLRKHIFERLGPAGLKAVIFGHIHQSYNQKTIDGIQFVNAALLDEDYVLTNKPIQICI